MEQTAIEHATSMTMQPGKQTLIRNGMAPAYMMVHFRMYKRSIFGWSQ